jgi:hypothetical protein
MSKPLRIGVIVIVVVVACLGVLAIEAQTKIVRRVYDNFVLDNENHYLPCEKLPTEAEVSTIAQEHRNAIQLIEQVNPGFVGVDIDTTGCPGKADFLVWYASHQDRVAIERIIGGNTFFGVPYRLQNR